MKKSILLLLPVFFFVLARAQNPQNFSLPSVTGAKDFTLSEAKGKFVALHFLLKTECPYCIRHTGEYFQKAATLPNVVQVFIKPDTKEEIREWVDKLTAKNTLTYPIYQDANAVLAGKYHIPGGYSFHGQVVNYPALVLLDTEGKEVFRYIGKSNSDRFSFEKLVAKIQELTNVKQ